MILFVIKECDISVNKVVSVSGEMHYITLANIYIIPTLIFVCHVGLSIFRNQGSKGNQEESGASPDRISCST